MTARKRKCLLISYGGGHASIISAVASRMMCNWEVLVLCVPAAIPVFRTQNIPYKTFASYADDVALRLGREIVERCHNPAKGIAFEESLAYCGVNWRDLLEQEGKQRAGQLFGHFGSRAFFPVTTMKEVIRKERPDAVIVTQSSARTERAGLLAARSLGVPTLAIEDLLGTAAALSTWDTVVTRTRAQKKSLVSKGVRPQNIVVDSEPALQVSPPEVEGLSGYVGIRLAYPADRIAVLNDWVGGQLMLRGIDRSRIRVTGQPALDRYYGLNQGISGIVRKRLGIEPGEQFLLLTSQAPYADGKVALWGAVEAVRSIRRARLIVKPHPSANGVWEEKELARAPVPKVEVRDEFEAWQLIQAADVVITEFSTTGLEAIASDKPLVAVNSYGTDAIVPYAQTGAAIEARNESEVASAVWRVLHDKDLREHLRVVRQAFRPDGLASERIVRLLEQLA